MLGFHIETYEIELRVKDGRMLQFELNAMKIEYEGKSADMVIFRDLTEKNKLIKALEQEQKPFQSVAESSGEWIWETDIERKYVYSNAGVAKILGYKAEEIIGTRCCDLMCQDNREENKKLFENSIIKKEQFCTTKKCLRKDGQISILESHIVPKYSANGKFAGFRGVDRDITERKKAEEELANNKNYLETILNSMLSGTVILDGRTHEIVDINPAALKMMGITREEAIGRACYKFLCQAEKGKCPITDLGLTLDSSERVLPTANGWRTSIFKSVTRLESNGRSLLVESFIDISERKEMEKRLLKSEKLAAIGELATMVAHDLRNPLQSISTAVYFVKKANQEIGNEKMTSMLKRIDDAVNYSEKIVRDLLDYSSDMKLELTETDLHSIVNQALSGMVIPAKIEVVDRTQETLKCHVDMEKIRRVILNLIANAFDAMPNGGILTIASREEKDSLELSIQDTGVGIPKEKMDRLWAPFVTTKAKGMGLGLPICKRIVEAHKGEICVETENGRGTTFRITIPIMPLGKENVEFFVNAPQAIFLETNKNQKVV